MGFTYPDKFSYLNTFMMQVAQRCSDNRGHTVLGGPLIQTILCCLMAYKIFLLIISILQKFCNVYYEFHDLFQL